MSYLSRQREMVVMGAWLIIVCEIHFESYGTLRG